MSVSTRRLALLVSSIACVLWVGPSARVAAAGGGLTRTYYIAADEVVWDYAPSGANAAEGRPFNAFEKPWMEAGPNVAGRKAKKAL
jgi:FtsP/CotA-like multicopper oxidase with cupredoxin domain